MKVNKPVKRVLVIGNGFDLYHKLPTSYMDYLSFAKNWNVFYEVFTTSPTKENKPKRNLISVRLGESNELTTESMQDFAKYSHLFCAKHIDYINEHIHKNAWYEYFSKTALNSQNWVDFEMEIYNVLQHVEKYYDVFKNIPSRGRIVPELSLSESGRQIIRLFSRYAHEKNIEYINLGCGPLSVADATIEKITQNKKLLLNSMRNELDYFNKCFNYFILEFVSKIKCSCYSEQIRELGDVYLLNFNYTYTYASVYGKQELLSHHPVHGEAKEENLVLGIPDSAFQESLEYVYFQKYFQRIQKRTGNFYREWLYIDNQQIEVYIMGHSLNSADKGILDAIFDNELVSKVRIYYHSQESYEKMIINLVDMYDRDFVIEQTGKGRVEFTFLDPPIKGKPKSLVAG